MSKREILGGKRSFGGQNESGGRRKKGYFIEKGKRKAEDGKETLKKCGAVDEVTVLLFSITF